MPDGINPVFRVSYVIIIRSFQSSMQPSMTG